MLKNGVAIRGSRHHWFSDLRPAAGEEISTTHLRGQVQVTLLSTLQRSAGSGARKQIPSNQNANQARESCGDVLPWQAGSCGACGI